MDSVHTIMRRPKLVLGLLLLVAIPVGAFAWRMAPRAAEQAQLAKPATGDRGELERRQDEEILQTRGVEWARSALAKGLRAGALDSSLHAPDRNEVLRLRVWELVERLGRLAESPDGFHGAALPLVEELVALWNDDGAGSGAEKAALVKAVLKEVVEDELRTPLQRGAVFMGLAVACTTDDFQRIFEPWVRDQQVSRELMRAAALAASRRGQRSTCSAKLSLKKLMELPSAPGVSFPTVYPMQLGSVVEPHAAAVMLEVLSAKDRLLMRIEEEQRLPDSELEAREATDAMVAREVLLLALGHRALVDPEIERRILTTAGFQDRKDASPSVEIRASLFIIHTLSNCNDAFLDFVGDSARSTNAVQAGLSRVMRASSVAPLNLEDLGRLHAKRRSGVVVEQIEFMSELMDLGTRLREARREDAQHLADFVGLLRELVGDGQETEEIRMASMQALGNSMQWDATVSAAQLVFEQPASAALRALALGALVEAARADAKQRSDIKEILQSIVTSSPEAWIRSDAASYLEEFDE